MVFLAFPLLSYSGNTKVASKVASTKAWFRCSAARNISYRSHNRKRHGQTPHIDRKTLALYPFSPSSVRFPRLQQGRCIFSWFGETKERHCKRQTDATETASDWEDYYRRPITKELWEEFRNERRRLREYLSTTVNYKVLAEELQTSINEVWSETSSPPPEYGPTGAWMYQFEQLLEENGLLRRVYRRYPAFDDSLSPQVVLEMPEDPVLAMSLTPDETCIACLVKPQDSSEPTSNGANIIQIREIESGRDLVIAANNVFSGVFPSNVFGEIVVLEWGPNLPNEDDSYVYSLYVVIADPMGRPASVILCRIDPSTLKMTSTPELVYQSNDVAFMVDVQRTKGCQHMAIRVSSKTSNETLLSPSKGPPMVVSIRSKQENVVYHADVGVDGDVVLLISDEGHSISEGDYLLSETSVDSLPLTTKPLCDPRRSTDDHFIEDMDLFRTHLVLYERSRTDGTQRIRVRQRINDKDSTKDVLLDLASLESVGTPRHWTKLSPVGNIWFNASFFRFELESLVSPGVVYEYNFETQQITRVSGGEAKIGSPHLQYETVLVESADNTKVPLSLFHYDDNESFFSEVPRPIVLVGYGSYGEPMDLGYHPGWKYLLEKGVVLAFAHTRGGGDLGRVWYTEGRHKNKMKSIEDYEACAIFLKKRYPDNPLVGKAVSAGGILVGAVVNRHPGLFQKVLLTNAFVDVARTMERSDLFLTEHEFDEYGNPSSDPDDCSRIRSYCPITNLNSEAQTHACVPTRFLVIGCLDDSNVPYWNATLYFRKLLGKRNDGKESDTTRPIFLELQLEGGHNFQSANRVEVLALEIAFVLKP